MCQLLGMNCNIPTDICFSFTGFQARGGLTDEHQDGWGIAFFEGRGVRQFLDSQASVHSPVADLVRNYPIKSKAVISHIRKATQGQVQLENTHLIDFHPKLNGGFTPVGTTDSELAFCYLLQELRTRFGDVYPGEESLFQAVTEITKFIGATGEFNFLFSNGELIYAHCSTHLAYIERSAPFMRATLKDQEMEVDFSDLTTHTDQVSIIATIPLTQDEVWTTLSPGTLCAFHDGKLLRAVDTVPGPVDAPSPI
jgi:predicted glutamine amidotransferase